MDKNVGWIELSSFGRATSLEAGKTLNSKPEKFIWICSLFVHHSSVISSSQKCGWFHSNLPPVWIVKQFISSTEYFDSLADIDVSSILLTLISSLFLFFSFLLPFFLFLFFFFFPLLIRNFSYWRSGTYDVYLIFPTKSHDLILKTNADLLIKWPTLYQYIDFP